MTVKQINEMTISEKLCHIQNEMKVPKNLWNKFGKYYYRNAETILETAKPICNKYECTLTVHDEIVQIGDRYYVKAIAELTDWNMNSQTIGEAYAREEENKKGMDGSQVTGACSSYARKYALNGLFNLDDVKDADTDEYKTGRNKNQSEPNMTELTKQYSDLARQLNEVGKDIHSKKVMDYVKENAQVDKVDITLDDPGAMERQISVFQQMLKMVANKK